MANYTKTTIGKESRIELHEKLSLTGAEISLNELPAGANVPFVHSHKENEEIYGILSGNGKAIIDGEEISLSTGEPERKIRACLCGCSRFYRVAAIRSIGRSRACYRTVRIRRHNDLFGVGFGRCRLRGARNRRSEGEKVSVCLAPGGINGREYLTSPILTFSPLPECLLWQG